MHKLVLTLIFFPDQNENNHGNKEVNKRRWTVLYQRTNEVSCCKFVWVIIQAETLGSQCLNSCPCSIQKDQESNPNNMLIFNKSWKLLTIVFLQRHLTSLSFIEFIFALRKLIYILMKMAIIMKSISISDICTTLQIFKEQSRLLIGDQYELRNFCIIVHEIDSVDDDTQDHHEDKDGNNADFEDFQHSVLLI